MRSTRGKPASLVTPSPRKAYTPPRLIQYGSILKLTQATGSGNGDAGMVMMATCL